jgi:GNAT superfamily N-acetyltransferase
VAGAAVIVPFQDRYAEEVAALYCVLVPGWIQTAESLRHRQVSEPERARRRSWVALDGDDVVGYATALFDWWGGETGKGRLWVGVREDRRRRGVGSELWGTAVAHLRGAKKLVLEVDGDPAGVRFAEKRGFVKYGAEVISRLDPRECELRPKPHEGFRVQSLRAVRDRERELFEFYGAAGDLRPADPENRVTLPDWRRFILENPLLDDDASVVVEDAEGRIVSLAWLLVDDARRRAENEWTATVPPLRARGLARLAKIASIRAAAGRGITQIVTGNDPDNLPMRELNRRLGYQELYERLDFERSG